jgi:hypothetical protein
MRVTNKKLQYELLRNGYFGNTTRIWDTPEEVLESNYQGFVNIRGRNVPGFGAHCGILPCDLKEIFNQKLITYKLRKEQLIISEDVPDQSRTIQGELLYNCVSNLFYFKYTFVKEPMRLAFEKGPVFYSTGLKTINLLKQYSSYSSYEDVVELMYMFPDHVIEVSVFNRPVGCIKGRTHIIWEVRCY